MMLSNWIRNLVQWFMTPAVNAEGYKDGLIVIASVSAVIWTGGLITMQLKKNSITLMNGLDFLQNAFMGTAIGMFVTGVPLRLVILLFGIFYTQKSLRELKHGFDLRRLDRQGVITTLVPQGLVWTGPYAKAVIMYSSLTLASMVAYLGVFVYPTQFALCIFGWVLTFFGMQFILARLYTDDPIQPAQEESISHASKI
jgi:uncharacterized membrane protein